MSPETSIVVIAALVLAVLALSAALFWALSNWWDSRKTLKSIEDDADISHETLATAPDGMFLWLHGSEHEMCSRRLAVMLDLDRGMQAPFADVLACFDDSAGADLADAVAILRAEGVPFERLLPALNAKRRLQVFGARSERADVLWMRDVSSIVEAPAKAARAQRLLLEEVLDALPLPVWLHDSTLTPVFTNHSPDAKPLSEIVHGLAARARDDKRPERESHVIDERAFHVDIQPLPDGRLLGFAQDAAPERALEAAVARHQDAQHTVLEGLTTAIAIFDTDMRLIFFNTAYAELWGLDVAWLATKPGYGEVLDRLREARRLPEVADFPAFKAEQMALFSDLKTASETLLHLPDGGTVRRHSSPYPLGGLVFAYEDESQQLDLERSYKTLSAVQRETLDNLYEGVAVFGADGRLRLHNPAFAELWSLEDDALDDNTHISDFVEKTRPLVAEVDDWDDYKERLVVRLMGRESGTGRIVRSDGLVLDYAKVPLPDGAVLLSYLDVTDSARVEHALRERAEAMAEANQLKSAFLANVGRELREPLDALKAEADDALSATLNELTRVIDAIDDLAAIEEGRLTLELDTVDILPLLEDARTAVASPAITIEAPDDIGWFVADRARLVQGLSRLLVSAVQASPAQDSVLLKAERDSAEVRLSVSDQGPGLPPEEMQGLVDAFSRGVPVAGGGLGIGLSLMLRFVDMHGGHVEIDSQPDQGTRIVCHLPTREA